jgi:uncharacterized protein (DUF1697 family)
MVWVVFLRAVNVGGTNRCQPALIAKQLAKFDIVNIGAVGTFVVREDVNASALRAAIAKKLPFKCAIMICPAKEILDLAKENPFGNASTISPASCESGWPRFPSCRFTHRPRTSGK